MIFRMALAFHEIVYILDLGKNPSIQIFNLSPSVHKKAKTYEF